MEKTSLFNEWISTRQPQPNATVRLFCFPYAGGGASIYRDWSKLFSSEIEVCPIQLPGRENRLGEPFINHLPTLVERLVIELQPFLNKPFAFFGHSMGALLSYQVTHALIASDAPAPRQLFLSAYRAPHLPALRQPIHQLPEEAFLAELRRLNGTPEDVLTNSDLLSLVLPTIRNDFAMLETALPRRYEAVNLPISAFVGLDDPDVSKDDMQAWEGCNSAEFKLRMLPGDHFYLHTYQTLLCRAVERDLLHTMAQQPPQTQSRD